MIEILAQFNIRAVLQAGTCSWPRVPEPGDRHGTHFTYQWEPDSVVTRARIAQGLMPEIHVWAAIPTKLEIIDMTTGFLVENCQRVLGADWPGSKPPEFFWGHVRELPAGVIYRPDLYAIAWALESLQYKEGLIGLRPNLRKGG